MKNNEIKWRFPGNNYTQDQGIDTPDMETFAKNPIASLAREACQNSIDAKIEGKPAIIEFKTFDIEKDKIPGIDRIEQEIDSCMEYRKNNKKIYDSLSDMKEQINHDLIHCIRVSDFNTRGLAGVNETDDSPFFLLTKGSGISDKSGSKGGSKGIGKFASFVASSFNTVFYSTLNLKGEKGYIGICKLCSTRMEGTDEKTIGIGYYGSNDKNMPIIDNLDLGIGFNREIPGTDIFILGFRKNDNWKKNLITRILDSFMCAIYYEDLVVEVDDIVINKSTLNKIIDDEELIVKKDYNNIKSQFILLSDSEVFRTEKEIDNYGNISIYLKPFSKEKADLATNECVMIRYPYMKIKTLPRISNVPCSAMCIIHDNELNRILRDIENAQHTNWEIDRIDDDDIKNEVKYIINILNDTIIDYAFEILSRSDVTETDVEGAGEFLPGTDDVTGLGNEEIITEKPKIVKRVKNKVKDKIGIDSDDDGNSLNPDIGNHTVFGDGSPIPFGENSSNSNVPHNSDIETGYNRDENGKEIMTIVPLVGMQYRMFVINKENGEYIVSFKSLYSEKDCELEIRYLDDSNTRYEIDIVEAFINEKKCEIKEGKIVNLNIEEGKDYKIRVKTTLRSLYTFEVKMYANR